MTETSQVTDTGKQAPAEQPIDTATAYKAVAKQAKGNQFQHNLFVLQSLVTKDFKLKYRRSVLGILWSVLNPLLMMIVMAAVFSYMFKFQIQVFPVYLILGTILFDYMSRSTTGAMNSVLEAQSLIKKVRIDKIIFPLEKVAFELVNFAISLIAAIAVMAYFRVVPSLDILWGLPLIIVMVTLFSMGLGLLVSALSVFFRDLMHLWGVLITAWTYLTPLFYPFDMLADWMQAIMQFNPMFHYVKLFRSFMTNDLWATGISGMEILIGLGMAVITFLVGLLVFRRTESKFILHI